ncbi:response regulator transcription factor [Ideonella azotifigens]|nr:response regulator transcription factor [Ideonella azotifigens]MCD2341390.1 response regulator transcription factor [Ideonella azotifigens]
MLDLLTIKVLVLYDDALLCAGLRATLGAQPDMVLLSPQADPGQADVVIADYAQGLRCIALGKAEPARRSLGSLGARVLILTRRDSEREIRHALESGVRGYLTIGCGLDELVDAVRALHCGMRRIGTLAAQRLADSVAGSLLTSRETDVLRLLVAGHGNKAIAKRLDIALGTVKSHLKSVFQKLDASNRTEVALAADKRGLLIDLPALDEPEVEAAPARWRMPAVSPQAEPARALASAS